MKDKLDAPMEKAGMEAFVQLFNAEKFFEAHEELEQVWAGRGFGDNPLRGLIQICAALAHIQKGNYTGARSVFARAVGLLQSAASPELSGLADAARSVIESRGIRFPKMDPTSARAVLAAIN